MKHIGKIKRSRFYAFALNEFRYRRVGFTCHQTQVAAEKSAYQQSGQSRFEGVRSGDRAPESDLYPQIIAGLEGLEEFARESFYDIDWDEKILIYRGQE
jgi:hypothetical protein